MRFIAQVDIMFTLGEYLMLMRFIAQVDIMFTLGEQSMRFRRSIYTHERPGVWFICSRGDAYENTVTVKSLDETLNSHKTVNSRYNPLFSCG